METSKLINPALTDILRTHVQELAGRIGERNGFRPQALGEAAAYIRRTLSAYGYEVASHPYQALGLSFENLETRLQGSGGPAAGTLVVGAHYDTAPGTPGADDNASGIAGLLELARLLRSSRPRLNIAFTAFATEEPPYFGTELMGSLCYAKQLHSRSERVIGMVCLEMIGFFSARRGLQRYPAFLKFFFPDRADFIGLVGNLRSRAFLARIKDGLKNHLTIPLQHASLPAFVPGVDFSDHRSFWAQGIPAVMITDTAFYRNANYHRPTDTAETLDYDSMGALVAALAKTLERLSQ